jgi:peptide chain release factor 2
MPRITLPADDEELLAECDFEAFRASGKGGQHVNKTDSAVRLRHRPTDITVTSQESRSQWQNRYICLRKIRERVEAMNKVKKVRKPTKKTWASKRDTLVEKKKNSEKKKSRATKDWGD